MDINMEIQIKPTDLLITHGLKFLASYFVVWFVFMSYQPL